MNNMKIKEIKRLIFVILFFCVNTSAYANTDLNSNETADILHQNGQIYLVVLVLLTIFAGIIFLLIRLEKKLNKLESQQKSQKTT